MQVESKQFCDKTEHCQVKARAKVLDQIHAWVKVLVNRFERLSNFRVECIAAKNVSC